MLYGVYSMHSHVLRKLYKFLCCKLEDKFLRSYPFEVDRITLCEVIIFLFETSRVSFKTLILVR